MKKISIVFLSLLVVFLVTGCGKEEVKEENKDKEQNEEKVQTLVCTATESEEGIDTESTISMTYQNDKLKKMQVSANFKITDASVKENWETFKEIMDESNQESNKDGVSVTIDVDDENYEYKTTLDIDFEKATKEALEEQGFSSEDENSTLDASKESAEADGYTCVVK